MSQLCNRLRYCQLDQTLGRNEIKKLLYELSKATQFTLCDSTNGRERIRMPGFEMSMHKCVRPCQGKFNLFHQDTRTDLEKGRERLYHSINISIMWEKRTCRTIAI